jgi:FkbM family methyltransferase
MQSDSITVARIPTGGKELIYEASNDMMVMRAKSLFTKEPDTIHWINQFKPDEVFIDIGANVGMYSIYAAGVAGARVYAFEPESQNYAVLNRNIMMNEFNDRVTAYPIALSNTAKVSTLNLSNFIAGGSCHTFGENTDFRLEERPVGLQQGCGSMTLNNFCRELGIMPDHIKIDVDGIEHLVLQGMNYILSEAKSVLIEINTSLDEHMELIGIMTEAGFVYSEHQVGIAVRKEGTFKGVGNYIFYKPDSDIGFEELQLPSGAWNVVERPEEVEDHLKSHVVDSINNSDLIQTPYNHCAINDFLPEDFYQELMENKPTDSELTKMSETGRTGSAYAERSILEFINDDRMLDVSSDKRKVLYRLKLALLNGDTIKAVLAKLGLEFDSRLGIELLYMRDKKGYSIGPHTDMKSRLATVMVYLPDDTEHVDLGTQIYVRNSGEESDGSKHFSSLNDEFTIQTRVPYLPNTALAFKRDNNSYHGREELQEDYDRDTLCLIIRHVTADLTTLLTVTINAFKMGAIPEGHEKLIALLELLASQTPTLSEEKILKLKMLLNKVLKELEQNNYGAITEILEKEIAVLLNLSLEIEGVQNSVST